MGIDLQSAYTSDLIKSFSLAARHRADIINMSWYLAYLVDPLAKVLEFMQMFGGHDQNGSLMVVAAGNSAAQKSTSKALVGFPGALVVGALDHYNRVSEGANGEFIDIAAPSLIRSLNHPKPNQNNFVTLVSGSSSSVPIVTGVSALLLSTCPRLSNEDIEALLKKTAEKITGKYEKHAGSGVINPSKAWHLLQTQPWKNHCQKQAQANKLTPTG